MRPAPFSALATLAVATLLLLLPQAASAAPCTPPIASPVACENTQDGVPKEQWEIDKAGDPTIQGFATQMSVNKGQPIGFKIKSQTTNYKVSILRLGYYDGDGARLMQGNITPTNTATQPNCIPTASTGLIDCGNWSTSLTWTVPATAVSGVYIALLERGDTHGKSHIIFVVRDDAANADIVLQTSDATWQAYNTYGGNSLYTCDNPCPPGNPLTYKAAFAVSYNRPLNTAADDSGRSSLFTGGEWPMIRFLEANGYDVGYLSQVDTQAAPSRLLNHKLFISSGHDEYWSAEQRASMEQARDAGVNLAFFTGNTGFWKTRYAPSTVGGTTPNRTLISYKDTHFGAQVDPVSWTGTWRDGRWAVPADNVKPENALTGGSFLVNSGTSRIVVPEAFGKLRLWRNTDAASLPANGRLVLAPSTLGYEWDVDADNGFRPAGNIRLSETTVGGLEVFTDLGSRVQTGQTATHHMTLYKASSGARVFNSNTVQWSWGLDDQNPDNTPADRNMQQATVNLLADLGDSQPVTRLGTLQAATPSSDNTAPTATVSSPPNPVAHGSKLTLTGTAADSGGGRVAGVEVSTDNGATWHPATSGTTSWTYTWLANQSPTSTIRARATDDSGNLGAASAGVAVTVNCPCSLWGANVAPPVADSGDTSPIEVGMRFRSSSYGTVSGMRFYKAVGNTGAHVGSLWNSDGQRLAQATFQNETASGWQTVAFSAPVEILPGTTYVISYFAPNGHYSATADYFYRSPAPGPNGGGIVSSPPLSALTNTGTSQETTNNGVFAYGATSTFPSGSFGGANYWVDPIFSPLPVPGTVTAVTAAAGGRTSANLTWTAPASGGPVTTYRVTPYVGAAPQTSRTFNGTPPETSATVTGLTQGTTYTFRVEALNPNGAGPASALSNAVTPQNPVAPSRPLAVTARPATKQALVSWTAPAGDGDSAITGYTVTPYIGATAQTAVQAAASARAATVTGLTNGVDYTFRVSATNGVGTSPASTPSDVATPQSTLFDFATPAIEDSGENSPVELGMKFKPEYSGTITGVRFYKTASNIGTHTGSLWNATGGRMAEVTFENESASGWQSATFAVPVAVTAGTTYVVSYYSPTGRYSSTSNGLSAGVINAGLQALAGESTPNGVFVYGSGNTYPQNSYRSGNYFVDVLYAVPVPGQVGTVSASAGGSNSASVTWQAPSTGGPATGYRVTPYVGTTAQSSKTVDGGGTTTTAITGLTTGTTYSFRVTALNDSGPGAASAASNTVTPTGPVAPAAPSGVEVRAATAQARVSWTASSNDGDSPLTGYTVTPYAGSTAQPATQVSASTTSTTITGLTNGTAYTFRVTASNAVGASPAAVSGPVTPRVTLLDFGTPSTVDVGENDAVEVGMKFRSSFAGTVTGIRFYKATANTGTHVGSLWNDAEQRIGQVTFTDESASGWQTATFSTPIAIEADRTYVASYFAPNGHYSVTSGGLASAVTNGPLTALANGTSSNGVFTYGSSSAYPRSSFNAGNYWVDVTFQPAGAPGQVTNVTGTPGQGSVALSWAAPTGGGPATGYTITPYIGATAQTPVSLTGTPPATSRTITGLTPGTAYTFRVQATNPSGAGPVSALSAAVTPLGATAPGAPTGVTAQGDSRSAIVSWTAPANDGGQALTGYTVTPYVGTTAGTPATVPPGTTRTRVSGLVNHTAYTFKVQATNGVGTGAASTASPAVTPRASLFELSAPGTVDSGEPDPVNLGVKFTSDVAGTITGLRFYKSAANTGTHVGTLYSTDNQVLRQATFTDETASGWQTVTFATPMPILAGTTYVASYLAPNGHYAVTSGAFASAGIDNPPLRTLWNSVSGNGVFAYSSSPAMPTASYGATNYWVDVLFAPGT